MRKGTLGLPIREARIGALSSACGRRARFANAQALLAISVTLNPAQRARDSNPLRLLSPLRGGLKRVRVYFRELKKAMRHTHTAFSEP